MATIKSIWIAQTRWLGGDEWTNSVYVGFSREDVERQIVDEANEDVKEEAKYSGFIGEPELYPSLERLIKDNAGEFLVDIYEQTQIVTVPKGALV